jgi:hypothetical protein
MNCVLTPIVSSVTLNLSTGTVNSKRTVCTAQIHSLVEAQIYVRLDFEGTHNLCKMCTTWHVSLRL